MRILPNKRLAIIASNFAGCRSYFLALTREKKSAPFRHSEIEVNAIAQIDFVDWTF